MAFSNYSKEDVVLKISEGYGDMTDHKYEGNPTE
jgi:hypothetical protein